MGIFTWLREWREKRQTCLQERQRSERTDQHVLFRYWDGEKTRHVDPFDIVRKLLAWQEEAGQELLAEAKAAKEPAASEVLGQLSTIFGVHPWDEATATGLTGWEILQLARQFEELIETVKKNGSPGPISPQPTDSTPSTGPEPQDEVEKGSLDSGSTPAESIPAADG